MNEERKRPRANPFVIFHREKPCSNLLMKSLIPWEKGLTLPGA
jgi:hypothetical protein